jgi:hypothetical protein
MLSAPTMALLICFQGSGISAQANDASLPNSSARASAYKTSFDCKKVKSQSVEEAICENDELATLDKEMAEVRSEVGPQDARLGFIVLFCAGMFVPHPSHRGVGHRLRS